MLKAGLQPWEQFFVNCRRSCINEKSKKGFSQQDKTAVFGNTPLVRAKNYDDGYTLNDIALLGLENIASGVSAPVGVPAVYAPPENPAEPGTFEVVLSHFGLPNPDNSLGILT